MTRKAVVSRLVSQAWARCGFPDGRPFCSWPAGEAKVHAQPPQSANQARLVIDSDSADEYQRRLREFLSASRLQDPAELPRQTSPSQMLQPDPTDALRHAHTSFAVDPVIVGTTTATVRQPTVPQQAAHAASDPTTTSRRRAALKDIPAFNPRASTSSSSPSTCGSSSAVSSHSCTSSQPMPASTRGTPEAAANSLEPDSRPPLPGSSSSSSSHGAAAAVAVAAPASAAPQPHPAAPTPVDWRELLRRAKEAQVEPPAGAQMLTDKFRCMRAGVCAGVCMHALQGFPPRASTPCHTTPALPPPLPSPHSLHPPPLHALSCFPPPLPSPLPFPLPPCLHPMVKPSHTHAASFLNTQPVILTHSSLVASSVSLPFCHSSPHPSRTHTYLRISLTERCNLRCTYCMPAEGVALTPSPQLLSTQEIMRLARLFVEAGVTKIRLTGGEPTLRRDLEPLIRQLSGELRPMGLRSVAITSNGLVLGRQLAGLREAGLNAVNISLDTLRPDRFEQLARRGGHGRVMEAIRTAVELGYDPVKVNVVLMRGVNEDEVPDFAALTAHQPINVRFIEYMPFDGNVWADSKMVPYRELLSRLQAAFPHTPLQRLDDPAGEVAKNYRLEGHRGSVSFITSMTQHFCSDCNRLRLLADGSLKVCLFGASEVSLRDAMRGGASDADLRAIIGAAVGRKRAAHAGLEQLAAATNRPMITIG
ncbi:hypothetical protein Agub_g4954, partial [Astrephomene gubernaculifera]